MDHWDDEVTLRLNIRFCLPWNSPDAEPDEGVPGRFSSHAIIKPAMAARDIAEIDFCLNHCPYPDTECRNCFSSRGRKREKLNLERMNVC